MVNRLRKMSLDNTGNREQECNMQRTERRQRKV